MKIHLEKMLVECGTKKARVIKELRVERFQLEMQLVVARLDAAGVVASEALSRTAFEAMVKCAENRAMDAQSAATTAMTER
jgi:hypothetical protein